ncbi:MAG: sensor histidine kinase [Bacilli bacterium]
MMGAGDDRVGAFLVAALRAAAQIIWLAAALSAAPTLRAPLALCGGLVIASGSMWVAPVTHPLWRRVVVIATFSEWLIVSVLAVTVFSRLPFALTLPSLAVCSLLLTPEVPAGLLAATCASWLLEAFLSLRGSSGLSEGTLAFAAAFIVLFAYLAHRAQVRAASLATKLAEQERQSDDLQHERRQLSAYAQGVHQAAVLQERNRMAGEIHDTIAHHMTALIVQMQIVEKALPEPSETLQTAIAAALGLARQTLADVRRSVRAQRDANPANLGGQFALLERLALEYGSVSGLQVQLTADHALAAPPAPILAQLYRAVQELLANARRHGEASRVAIRLHRNDYRVIMEVEDNGSGRSVASFGYGLSTMRERLEAYGGALSVAIAEPSGYVVTIALPVWATEERSS